MNKIIKLMFRGKYLALLLIFSCTNLEEKFTDKVEKKVAPAATDLDYVTLTRPVVNLLSQIFAEQTRLFNAQSLSTDEAIPPTRGSDWDDAGKWRRVHLHQWTTNDEVSSANFDNITSGLYQIEAIKKTVIDYLPDNKKGEITAVLDVYKAYYRYLMIDLFGTLCKIDADATTKDAISLNQKEAGDWLISDLEAALPNLKTTELFEGAPTIYTAYAILCRAYIQRPLWDSNKDNPANTAGYKYPDKADATYMSKVIDYANKIKAGGFSLVDGSDYFLQFSYVNAIKPYTSEKIFYIPEKVSVNRATEIHNWSRRTLHYYQSVKDAGTDQSWNGFTTLSDFYDKIAANPSDKRLTVDYDELLTGKDGYVKTGGLTLGFLYGQQRMRGENLTTRDKKPLIFSKDVDLYSSSEEKGIRVLKYVPQYDPASLGLLASWENDQLVIRYGEILLLKAEAQFRSGATADALASINELRINRGITALSTLTAQDILDESGRELYWESIRRSTLLRFNKFRDAWQEKPADTDLKYILFPIPAKTFAALGNPYKQNPGY